MEITLLIVEKSWNCDFEFLWEPCAYFKAYLSLLHCVLFFFEDRLYDELTECLNTSVTNCPEDIMMNYISQSEAIFSGTNVICYVMPTVTVSFLYQLKSLEYTFFQC